jgi:membrane protein YqaA with SNARE-associated domain
MAAVAVVDASVFPVPPFALLGPMVLAQPRKAPVYALTGTAASLLGGFIGYSLGFFLSGWVRTTLGINLDVQVKYINMTVSEVLNSNFWFLALAASVLPTPFKIVALGCGLLHVDLLVFFLAALLGRSARMFGFCLTLMLARDWAVEKFKITALDKPSS